MSDTGSRHDPSPPLAAGATARLSAALSRSYTIERELGQGGMATVYLAKDLKHDRQVAIKVLREELSASLGAGRFLREIKIAAQLQHPHILPLLDSGEVTVGHPERSERPHSFLYFVMPYIKGQSLRERLAREGELPVQETVHLISEVVDALVEAHEHGVVHRDIKPDNVMLSGRHALVTDFGVAKAISEATGRNTITTLGVAVGTPTYMSPEQAAADPHVDHRSDIYSVGVMAYEMLTGRPPFTGSTPQQVLAAHVTETPDPVARRRPAVPPALDAIIMRCLAKRPADRFQTAAELHAALEPLGTPSSGITPTQTQPVRAVVLRRRSWRLLTSAVVLLIVGVVAALMVSRRGGKAAPRAIAVLPFENVTRDTAFDYLADGIANDVRSGLMKLPGLSVKARTSSQAARGKPVHDAGALLNVGVVLQGAFRRTADQTSVTVDLVNVSDESALWTGSFILPADGSFAVAQDSITSAVARAMHLQASAGATTALAQRGTKDPVAYDFYLKAEHFFAARGKANLRRAIDYYRQAIARDSSFARAYAGLSMLLTIYPSYALINADSVITEAALLAHKALALDSTLAEAHLALADVLTVQQRPDAAEPEYVAAVTRDPRNVTARQWHGDNLAILARVDEAIREGRASVDLDPLSSVAANDFAYSLLNAGQFDEAIRVAHRATEIDSTMTYSQLYVGLAFAFAGKTDSAVAGLGRFVRLDSLGPLARGARVFQLALGGHWPEAERALATLERAPARGSRDLDLVVAYTALENKEAALAALERLARERSFYAASTAMGCEPTFGPLKAEPRFLAAMKQMGQGICPRQDKWPIPPRPKR